MLWIKQNARLLLCSLLALLLGLGIGVLVAPQEAAAPQETLPVEPVGQMGKPSILPNTKVTLTYHFLLCGHTLAQEKTGGELVGYTPEDIMAAWPDARVMELNHQIAKIERELTSYCPDHYVLFSDGVGGLSISKTMDTDWTKEEVQNLNYDASELPHDVLELLEDGQVFDSLEEINAYLEDVES